jgi:carbonic anhydrase
MFRRLLPFPTAALGLAATSVCLLGGCGGADEHGIGAHASVSGIGDGADLVHAAAPDAVGKSEHGYCLEVCGAGCSQSPIDILTRDVEPGSHAVALAYGPTQDAVRNLGHTVQLDYRPGGVVQFDGKAYELLQLHFHTPSEHRINGLTFPLEAHIVHRRTDPQTQARSYLVVGALFQLGADHSFLERVLARVPREVGAREDVHTEPLGVRELLEGDLGNFFHYAGSLTTPPFTEAVEWVVLERIFEAGPEQVRELNRIEGNNARHVQSLSGRKVDAQRSAGF